jgi:uncharacterized metal-binding protein YceD (DUF177 family)
VIFIKSFYLCALDENWVVGKGIFDIDIYKLADGEHSFEFSFDSSFFDLFEDSIVKKGNGRINVMLEKAPTMLSLTFLLKGEVELICDRSLDPFMFPIDKENLVRLKFGDHQEEFSEDLFLISTNTQKIDIGQFVYEFITLAIPMKKLHPRYKDDTETDEMVFYSADDADESSNDIDPRWNELKKLKKINNGTS